MPLFNVAAVGLSGEPVSVTEVVITIEVGMEDEAEVKELAADAAEAETEATDAALMAEDEEDMALGSVK